MKKIIPLIIIIIIMIMNMTACSKTPTIKPYSKEGYALGTIISVTIYSDKKVEDVFFDELFAEMDKIEKKMTINEAVNSEVEQINEAAGKDFVKVSDETYFVIKESVDFTKSMDGKFDLTIGPLVKLWNIGFDNAKLPKDIDIEKAVALLGVDEVTLNEMDHSVKLERAGMMIDLGGIAKGYAADRLGELIKNAGYNSALINLSSSILCVGTKPENLPFKVGIRDPFKAAGSYVGVVSVENNTVDTSGTYERFIVEDGIIYHHILDPATGYAANNELLSISIITPKCIDSDALSTGVFIMGLEEGYKYIESLDDVEAIFVTGDKEIYITDGAKALFKLTAEEYKIVEMN
ncbi:MAG: FAD:protein FMN transferase [Vallitaleaceae bacterium]|nr:FAD:protein FMN transferase [Vallitaleaceae bacterium]